MRIGRLLFLTICLLAALEVRPQSITGTVVDTRGAAVSDAEIAIVRDKMTFARTTSDASGHFSIATPARLDVRFRVIARGFAIFDASISNVASTATIVLEPAVLSADVTVSITRTETRLDETPASIVVLERDDLDATGSQTIDDTLRQVAGFTLFRRSSSKTSNPTTQGANIRGIGGSGAARTSVQFDGVSLNDAFGGWTSWSRIPEIAIERVEVLRGGASALYGSSALSGAIDLGLARERNDALRFEGSAGTSQTYDGGLFAAKTYGAWYGDVAVQTFQTAGYIPVDPDQRGAVDTPANSRYNSGFVTLERKFGELARVFARGHLYAERRDNGTSLTNNRTYFRQAVAGADVADESFGSLRFRGAVDAQVYDQTFSAVSADRNSENLTRVQRVPSRSLFASALWSRTLGDHAISAQADTRYVRGFSEEKAVANNIATAATESGGKEFSFGLSAQDFWRVTKRLNLSLSLRFDRWREFGGLSRTLTLSTNQTSETIFPERIEQSFSPRLAAIFKATDVVSVFGSYSHSFRAPSLNELYRSFRVGNVLTLANENLTAERASTFEGGVILNRISRRLTLRANVFQTVVSDPVISITLSSGPVLTIRRRENVGETRTRGFETDVEIKATSELELRFGYLLTDSRVLETGANTTLSGKFLPQVARQQLTTQAVYHPLNRLTLSVQARASDAQYDDDLNTFRLRPFFVMDAYTSYRFKKWFEIFVAVENVFDNRYDIGLTPVRTIAGPRFVRSGLRLDLSRKD